MYLDTIQGLGLTQG
jgi:hypothetical protein